MRVPAMDINRVALARIAGIRRAAAFRDESGRA
jgi:hypothetical protein